MKGGIIPVFRVIYAVVNQRFAYFYAILFSLIIHVILISCFILGWVPAGKASLRKPLELPVLQLIEPASSPQFISSEDMPDLEKAVENPQFVSDRNTQLRSQEKGKDNDLVPTQQGRDMTGLQLKDKPEGQKLSHPSPAVPIAKEKKEELTQDKVENLENPQKTVLLARQKRWQEHEAAKKAFLARSQAAPPSEPFSFRQEKTTLRGADVSPGEAGVNAEATPLGRYKAKVYQLIGSQWRFMVRRQNSLLSYGTIKIRFWLLANGSLERLEVLNQTPGSELLGTLSQNSIRLCSPYEKFSEIIQQQVGNRMMLEATFTIY